MDRTVGMDGLDEMDGGDGCIRVWARLRAPISRPADFLNLQGLRGAPVSSAPYILSIPSMRSIVMPARASPDGSPFRGYKT